MAWPKLRLESEKSAADRFMGSVSFRVHEIDGLRGWAALVVLLFHAFQEMLRNVVPGVNNPFLSPFLAGDYAVGIFFVLSGDALSAAFFAGGGPRVVDRMLLRRYFRLTIPIAMACLMTYLVMRLGLDYHAAAAVAVDRPDWLGKFLRFDPSIADCLRYAFVDVYVDHQTSFSYDPFLWTMSIELLGSIYIFGICYVWAGLRKPHWICVAFAVGLWLAGSLFSLFFVGIVFGYERSRGLFRELLVNRPYQIAAAVLLLLTVSYMIVRGASHEPIGHRSRFVIDVLFVFIAYSQFQVRSFFANPVSRFLGNISFPLYLIHFQVLISLMSWLVLHYAMRDGFLDGDRLVLSAFLSVAACFPVAYAFRLVEKLALSVVDTFIVRLLQ